MGPDMDISSFDTKGADAGAVMTVLSPVDGSVLLHEDGKPVTLHLAGIDSDRYRRAQRENQNRRLEQQRRGQQTSADTILSDARRVVVACTISWEGLTDGGKPFECTPQNADALYTRLPWLQEQAETFIASRSNFMKASAAT